MRSRLSAVRRSPGGVRTVARTRPAPAVQAADEGDVPRGCSMEDDVGAYSACSPSLTSASPYDGSKQSGLPLLGSPSASSTDPALL